MRRLGLFFLLLFIASLESASAQNCALSGTAEWNEQLRSVIAGCESRIASRDGRLTLIINTVGQIQVADTATGSTAQVHVKAVLPPAMTSWSPKSEAFFVNDGQGSGMSSAFRLFRVKSGEFLEDGSIEKKAVALYRNQKKCSSGAADPNVWGIGWSSDGVLFYLLIQATVNDPCGEPGAFLGMTVNLADGSIARQLSEASTRREFRTLLPREVYSK